MATFNYRVDTEPMAHELSSVSNHVNGTTTAVVAMQTAIVVAEKKASDHICSNVNKGFYTLMRSQISQKIAKLQSDVNSHLMKLNQLKKNLLGIQSRMQRDYNMTSNRYLKLFNGLNANLKQRIFELDKPIINFALTEVEQITNRTKNLTATVPVSQIESLSASQKILVSNVKYHGLNVIDSMKYFLEDMSEQKVLTNKILLHNIRPTNSIISIPIIISESNHDKHNSKTTEISICNIEMSNNSTSSIINTIQNKFNFIEWKDEEKLEEEVISEFNKLVSKSSSSERIKTMAKKLFIENKYQTIKTIKL